MSLENENKKTNNAGEIANKKIELSFFKFEARKKIYKSMFVFCCFTNKKNSEKKITVN